MRILVSKCLLGYNCRYKGDNCYNEKVAALAKDNELIPVCPEVEGGLPTPRDPSEIVGDKIISKTGKDVTAEYVKGAHVALKMAQENNVDLAILKSLSPSCGCGEIYDGTFTGNKKEGFGVTAKFLLINGFKIKTEKDL